MTLLKRILSFLALTLGVLGTIVCLALIIGVWLVNAKLSATTQDLFGQVNDTLAEIRERVPPAQERFEAAKITVQDIEHTLREWTKKEVGQQLSERLELSERTERLASSVQQADQWLEMSEAALELIQRVLSASRPSEVDKGKSVGALLEEIATLRTQLSEIEDFANAVHERTTPGGDRKSIRERIEQAAQLAVRAAATLGLIEAGLEELDTKLYQAQLDLQELESSTLRWILIATLVITLLVLWMLAGQFSLCRWAWQGLRSRRQTSAQF